MTSQKDQIQSLIQDIERALSVQRSNKPWVRSSDVAPQREALARAQAYLQSLQQTFEAPGGWGPVDPSTGQIADADSTERSAMPALPALGGSAEGAQFGQFSGDVPTSGAGGGAVSQTAENVLQSLLTEMKYLKSSALEPLRLEMDELRSERDRLQSEVKSLDEQREAAGSGLAVGGMGNGNAVNEAQLNDFLTALMGRLQENLTSQVGQTLSQLESDHAAAIAQLSADDEAMRQLRGSGQIEELRQLQGRSDQLLVNIDSTLQRMFETLQQNIDSYQRSLNEGLDNMHSLGRQGEVIVRSLVDHLTAQLGQTTPPEPAFFPARSAAPLNLVDEDVPSEVETPLDDSSSNDTVSSLDEVLPDLAADEPAASADEINADEDIAPEDCIREDGTIDLDLLKLDIDREDEAAVDPDEVMVDAAIADAQVAATESGDAEIEAKVLPTAESLYLADLTFDDLTVDPSISLASESALSESALSEADRADLDIDESSAEALPTVEASSEIAELEDAELAAILPDLGDPPSEALVAESADAEEANADSDTDNADSRGVVLGAAALGAGVSAASLMQTDAEDSDLDDGLDTRSLDDGVEDGTEESAEDASDSAEKPESALAPDIPDADDELIDSLPLPGEGDDALSNDLAAELEVVSRDAEQAAAEAVEMDLDSLTSDLEEAVVFEGELPEPAQLSDSAEPLDSALIPDRPAVDNVEDSLQDSLDEMETVETAANEQAANATLSPTDFDDDLDFYREDGETADEGAIAADAEETTSRAIEETDSDTAEGTVAATVAGAAVVGAAAVAPVSPAAEPVDPFVTAELERSFDDDAAAEVPIVADEPPVDSGDDASDGAQWFLGVDIGTTGLSAVLMDQVGDRIYPLCWRDAGEEEPRFRLPAVAQVIGRDRAQPGFGEQIGEVGIAALQSGDNRLLRHIKPLLKVGIPHGNTGEPWVQWSDQMAMPLQEVQSALSELLKSLSPQRTSCQAIGLDANVLRRVLANLSGVVVGYPTNWPDTYSFNVREALLSAGLVTRAEQIFFVEESIAVLLSALPDPNKDPADFDDQQPGLYNCLWSGGTVVLSAGATLTEAVIADLPSDLEQLSHQDFAMRSFGYAGDSLDQDIICQLLHLPAQHVTSDESDSSAGGLWRSLGLNALTLPRPGEADRAKRYRLRQRLNASKIGRRAIAIAQALKVDLQEVAQVEVSLGDLNWTVKRKDLETKVFLPYIQRINRQVNALLGQSELSAESVKQVICTGGSASLSAIARWLRQKFPNATIIQDTYSGEYSNSCSRVAYGLANLCHYPNVIDGNRHQYSDYFLLLELLRILPDQPLPAGGILHLLEQRGIDTQACQMHILALIEGHLPPGLVPTDSDRPLISAQSPDIPTYQAISELPLFRKQGGQIYIADAEQGERLRQHLESVLASKAQTLNKAQSLQLAAETV